MSSRSTLRLPAPPPKRQRVAASAGHHDQQPPVAAATAGGAPPPAAPPPAATASLADDDEGWEADAPGAALPNDTVAALQLLRTRFPPEARTAPFATKAQLYTVLTDRTAADRALEEARRCNAVRLLQLPCGRDEFAAMLTADYTAALAAAKAMHLAKSNGTDDGSSGGTSGGDAAAQAPAATAAAAAAAAEVFDWFGQRVLPACTDVMITHAELLALLAGSSGGGSGGSAGQRPRPGGSASTAVGVSAAGPAAGAAAAWAPDRVTDAHVSLLLAHGFLTRHTGGPDGYLFSMPNAGAAVRSVAAGRAEVLGLLQRRRQPELLEAELMKRKLQRSVLGVRWHVADMVGSGALLRIDTTVGPLLRVARRSG